MNEQHVNNVTGSVVVMGSVSGGTITNTYTVPVSDAAKRDELQQLVGELQAMLLNVPQEHREDAEVVQIKLDDLLAKASKPKPNRKVLEIDAEGLKKASENIADITSNIVSVAAKITAIVLAGVIS